MRTGLTIKPKRFGNKLVAFVAVAALVLQPAYSLIVAQVAAAESGYYTVRPSALQGWSTTRADAGATAGFITVGSPLDSGSLELKTPNDNNAAVRFQKSVDVKLSDLSGLNFQSKVVSNGGNAAVDVSVRLALDNDGDGTIDQSIVYEPYYNGTVQQGSWQYWDAFAGKFWGAWNPAGGYDSNKTLAEIPGIGSNTRVLAVSLGLGSWNPGTDVLIDDFRFNGEIYNFETDPYVPTAVPTRPSLSGNVIYDSTPVTLPSNLLSEGFQATQTRAFGDKITFAGSDRALDKVAVTLSSWACQNGSWTSGCVTTPGSTFSHPVTLNIYNVASDGSVGSLIGSKTQTFDIPYRPTADPTCGSATQWRDTNGNCFNGLNHVVVFDASGVTVPDSVIYSVAYNTQSYGTAPIGVDGPYSSLNVSLATGAASVGTNVNTDEVFWDSTYGGRTAGLKADSGWGSDGNPAVTFTATTPDTTKPSVTLLSPTSVTFDSTDTDLVVKATDNVGLNKVVANIYKDGSLYKSTQSAASGATEFTHTVDLAALSGIGLLPVGSYSVKYNAVDLAGNLSATKTFNFTVVDKVKPTVALITPTAHMTGSNSVAIQVDAADDRGLNKVVANIYKNGSLYKSTQTAIGGAKTGTHIANVNLPDGTYTIRYNASDLAGNIASTGNFDITVDTQAPGVPTLETPANNATLHVNNFWFEWADVTGAVSYEVQFSQSDSTDSNGALNVGVWAGDASHNQPTESRAWSAGATGTWYWQVRAVDAAGNKSAWTAPWKLTIDLSTPPVDTDNGGTNNPGNTGGSTTGGNDDTDSETTQTPQLFALQPAATPAQILAAAADGNTDVLGATDNESTPTVKGASDQSKSLASTANPEDVLGASDNKLFGLVWYWWLLIAAAVVAAGWWFIAARRRRDGDDA